MLGHRGRKEIFLGAEAKVPMERGKCKFCEGERGGQVREGTFDIVSRTDRVAHWRLRADIDQQAPEGGTSIPRTHQGGTTFEAR